MLTIKQLAELKRLKTKYGYDLALSKKLDKNNKIELLASLITKELHDEIQDKILEFYDIYPESDSEDPNIAKERILMAIFGSITGQIISSYGKNKTEASVFLNTIFDEYQEKHLGEDNE